MWGSTTLHILWPSGQIYTQHTIDRCDHTGVASTQVRQTLNTTPLPTRISTIALHAVTWAATYAIGSHTHPERPARTFRLLHIVQVYRDLGAASTSAPSRLYSERISARMPLPTARAAWTAHALGPARRTLLLALSRHCTACTSPDIIVSASSVAGQPFEERRLTMSRAQRKVRVFSNPSPWS